jgi:NADH-quinone oxidoreductase subunit I
MKLTNRSKVVSNKEMTLAEKIYLPAIFTGMGITFKHAVRTVIKVLPQYIRIRKYRSREQIWRGQHVLKRDEEGRERCTACGLCAVACPAEAITMTAAERTKEEKIFTEKKNMLQYMKSIC